MKNNTLIAFIILLAQFTSAHAGLIGDTVGIRYVGAGDTGVQSVVVGSGEEGNFFSNQFFDFNDFSFSIRSTNNFCGIWGCSGQPISLQLTGLDFGQPLSNVILSTSLTGVVVTFGNNFVNYNWNEQSIPANTYLSARFETGQSVPEPASLVLISLGLAGWTVARRKKWVFQGNRA